MSHMTFRIAPLVAASLLAVSHVAAQSDSTRATQSDSARLRSLSTIRIAGRADDLTGIALRLLPHLFVRPGELRWAEWREFDFDKAV